MRGIEEVALGFGVSPLGGGLKKRYLRSGSCSESSTVPQVLGTGEGMSHTGGPQCLGKSEACGACA